MMSKAFKQKLVAYGLVMPAFLVVMMTVAYPILSAVIQSFQDEKTGEFTLDNYLYFFTEPMQIRNILYTLFVVIMTVVIAIVVAYLLALYLRFVKSKIARTIGTLYLLPRFVPAMCAVYAMITIIRDSGFINRIGALFGLDIKLGLMYHASGMIVMNLWFNIPFAALMITAGLGAIPDSIIESAKIDGASQMTIFARIVLPISKPVLATIGLFLAFGYWNDWFQSALYIQKPALQSLQALLNSMQKNIEYLTQNPSAGMTAQDLKNSMPKEGVRMAIAFVVAVPIACVYPFFQKYFISGLTVGAVKG